MQQKIKDLLSEVESFTASSKEEVESFRLKYLSKKRLLADICSEMKNIAAEERKEFGRQVNELKTKVEEKFKSLQDAFEGDSSKEEGKRIDLTLPAEPYALGARHPISIVRSRILEIFSHIGFSVA